jgi:hypothetical protein
MRGIQNESSVGDIDRSKINPGNMVQHGLLGDVEIVKVEGNTVIVKDANNKQYRLSVMSIK